MLAKMAQYLGVRYVYDEAHEPLAKKVGAKKGKRLPAAQIPQHLAALPPDMLNALEAAAAQLNPFKISKVVDTLWTQNAALAEALEGLAAQFNYKEISTLVAKARESKG